MIASRRDCFRADISLNSPELSVLLREPTAAPLTLSRETPVYTGVSLDRLKRSRLSREIQAAGGGGQTVRGITFKI